MDKYTEMKQKELRAECKAAGFIGYSDMKLEDMRKLLRDRDAAKPAAMLSDEDRKQLTDEAADRKAGSAPKDDFTMSDEELAKQRRAGNEQDAKNDAIVEGRTTDLGTLPEAGMGEPGRCPHCGELTSREGVITFEELVKLHGAEDAAAMASRKFSCLGCDGQWGEDVGVARNAVATPVARTTTGGTKGPRAPSGTSNGLKIEANRETRNGVTRPSAGGKCRAVWDMLDDIGTKATAKQAREQAATNGFDKTTTMVQFYKWRKFQGIEGRQ
jgi:hypothetical protein